VFALTSYALVNGAFIIVNTITVAGAAIRLWRVYALIVNALINSAGIAVLAVNVRQTSTDKPC
jgi:hypothetical protein